MNTGWMVFQWNQRPHFPDYPSDVFWVTPGRIFMIDAQGPIEAIAKVRQTQGSGYTYTVTLAAG